MQVFTSIESRDAPSRSLEARGSALLTPFAHALRDAGLQVTVRREATAADVTATGSPWARRLGIPRDRQAWLLRARRPL